ncbi:unnamed protein product, partial [Mesorhabditis spiculigera]
MDALFRTRRVDDAFLRHSDLDPINSARHLRDFAPFSGAAYRALYFIGNYCGICGIYIYRWIRLTQAATVSALLCHAWSEHLNLLTGGALYPVALVEMSHLPRNGSALAQVFVEKFDVSSVVGMWLCIPLLFCSLTVLGTVSVSLMVVCSLVLSSCALVAFFHADTHNWLMAEFFTNGAQGLLQSSSLFLLLPFGIDALSSLLEETSHPRKKIGTMFPLLSVGLSLIVFIFSTVVSLTIRPDALRSAAILPELFRLANVPSASYLMAVCAFCGLSGSLLVSFLPGSRMLSQLTNDRLLPLPSDSARRPYTATLLYAVQVFVFLWLDQKVLLGSAAFLTTLRAIAIISLTQIQHYLPEPIGVPHETTHYRKIRPSVGSTSVAISNSYSSSTSENVALQMKVAKSETEKYQKRLEKRMGSEASELLAVPRSVSQYHTIGGPPRENSISSFAAVNKGHNCVEEACSHTGSQGSGRVHLYARIDPDIPNVSVFNSKNANRQYAPIDPMDTHIFALKVLILFLTLSTLLSLVFTTLGRIHVSSIVLLFMLFSLLVLTLFMGLRLPTNDLVCRRQSSTPCFPYSTYGALFLLCTLLGSTTARILAVSTSWLVFGLLLYFGYGFRHSTERYSGPCLILQNEDARRASEEQQCERIVEDYSSVANTISE